MRIAPYLLVSAGLVVGCASQSGQLEDGGVDAAPPMVDAGDVGACTAPDMLVILDRTLSMARRPDGTAAANTPAGHMETKWHLAITAIEALTAQLDTSVRFGLELFPQNPGAGCVTLTQRLTGTGATNPSCEHAEIVVPPTSSAGAMIASALDPETTLMCRSTPIGLALEDAATQLAASKVAGRDQYVTIVTDGNDTCDQPLVLATTQALAANGVKTFVIAFAGSSVGIDGGLLNDVACAGRTAIDFPAGCTANAGGDYVATDRAGPALYLAAQNAATLTTALQGVSQQVCCGCIL